jgi:Tfp pilus assembly protein PilF
MVLGLMGRVPEAERELAIAVSHDSNDWRSYIMMGNLYHGAKRYDEEAHAYKKALAILPPEEAAMKQKLEHFLAKDEEARKIAMEKLRKKREREKRIYENAY